MYHIKWLDVYALAVPSSVIHPTITMATAPQVGENYTLTCTVPTKESSGLTNAPKAQWFYNKMLATDETEGQSTLTFSPLKTSHAGSYRCEGSVTSPALEQPLVTNSTWELTVKSKFNSYFTVAVMHHWASLVMSL